MVIVHHTVVNCYCTIGRDVEADSTNCRIMSYHHKEQANTKLFKRAIFSKETL